MLKSMKLYCWAQTVEIQQKNQEVKIGGKMEEREPINNDKTPYGFRV